MADTVARCVAAIESRSFASQMSVNVAKLVTLRDDPELRRIVDGCQIINADGQGIVWASKLLGDPLPERVAGIDLMYRLLAEAEQRGYSVYVLGAKDDVLQKAVERLRSIASAAALRRLARRLLSDRRGGSRRRVDPRLRAGSAVRGDELAAQGVLPGSLRREHGRPVRDGRRRRDRRRQRGHPARAAELAEARAGMALPRHAGAPADARALRADEHALRRAVVARGRGGARSRADAARAPRTAPLADRAVGARVQRRCSPSIQSANAASVASSV